MKTYLEQLEQLEQLERLPVSSLPEVPISSRKPKLCFISFHPRNHQKFVCGSLFFCFYAAKLRLLFGISKVFGAFSWWFVKK